MDGVKVILVLIVCGTSHANITVFDYNTDHIRGLAEFAASAYHFYCDFCKATLIVHDNDEIIPNYFLKMLTLEHFNMSIISLSLAADDSNYELNGIFVGTIIELTIVFWSERFLTRPEYFLNSVERSPYWNRNSKMLIIATGSIPTDYTHWLDYTFKTFWKRKILRVFICFLMNEHMHIYMYNPFIGDFVRNISKATAEQYKTYLEYDLLDLYGYPLKTFAYDINPYNQRMVYGGLDLFGRPRYYGLDGHFMTEVLNILNVTEDIRRESKEMLLTGPSNNNSKALGLSKFFEKYDFDILFTAIPANRESNVDYLFLHERDDLCLVVPTGLPVPQYWYIFLVIPIEMWLGIVTSLLLVALFLHLLRRPAAMLDTYRVIINVPLVDSAQPVDLPERTVLATWIVFALFSTAVFQCTMTSTLVLPKYYDDIETIQDVIRVNLTIYASDNERNVLAANLKPDHLPILKNIVIDSNMTLEKMINRQYFHGYLVRAEIARIFLKYVKTRRDGRPRYQIVREHPVPNAQTYVMPAQHPYYEEMLWIINKVHESGLYSLWRTDDFGWTVKHARFAKRKTRDTPLQGNTYVPLSIVHLESAFLLLLIGEALAILVFLVEFTYKMTKNK